MNKPSSYIISIPERTLRATAALGGGLITETSRLLLPHIVRNSRVYQVTIGRLLRIMVELVGGIESSSEGMPVKELAVRKTAGNIIELAGVVAAGWSPLWLLAAVADITNGTRAYLQTLVSELKAVHALPASLQIDSVEELLSALEGTSAVMADTVDLPPLNVADMRKTWRALREHISELPDAASLDQMYQNLQMISQREGISLLTLSTTIAAGTIRSGMHLGDVHIFAYYRETVNQLKTEGLLTFLRRITQPYLWGAAKQFDPRGTTYTQRILQRGKEPGLTP